ncbi:unnamed protein product, partial [marine sediment metagenome]
NPGPPVVTDTITNAYTVVTTPTVSTVNILSGGGDANNTTNIQIIGSDFVYIPKVEIGTSPATRCTDVVFYSDTELRANVPSGLSLGTYSVTVINPLNQSGTGGSYTVNPVPPGEPKVTSVAPSTGKNNDDTDITITGTSFTGATGVTVGLTACTFTFVSDTEITATVPAGIRVGDYDVTVTTPSGTGTLTHGFTVG